MPTLTCSIDHEIATLVLGNPPGNRLLPQLAGELQAALDVVETSGARALLLRAEGDDFCVGASIVPWSEMDRHALRSMFDRFMEAFNRFERLAIPTVVAVQGNCAGGGFELAIRADIIIAGETARFFHPEQTLGLVTMLGGVYRLAERLGRAKAMAMVLTSEPASAHVMEGSGVVERVVPDADLVETATALVTKIARGATRSHAVHKTLLRLAETAGIAATDAAILDIGLPLFETEDVKSALPAAIELMKAGKPRTAFPFKGY